MKKPALIITPPILLRFFIGLAVVIGSINGTIYFVQSSQIVKKIALLPIEKKGINTREYNTQTGLKQNTNTYNISETQIKKDYEAMVKYLTP